MHAADRLFRKHFGLPPTRSVHAPGRLELLGNHTDYNQGLVLAAAVDRAVQMAVSPRTDGKVEVVTAAFPKPETFRAHEPRPNPSARWADYVKGVLHQLQKRGVHFTGFNAAIDSDLPPGAGLGSSAALEVATALAVRALHPYRLTATASTVPPARRTDGTLPPLSAEEKLEIAKLCQAAENEFVGLSCGLLDPVSSLFGRAFHAIEIDCQSLAIEPVPMVGEVVLVVCNTGLKHELVTGGYNELREQCEGAARALRVKSLRAVDPPRLSAERSRLTQRQHDCAGHITGEIQRVLFGVRALREGDFVQFGQYMFQSHESSRDLFRNSCTELDLLVEIARATPGCLGARLTGGGFGGATVNLIEREQAKTFCGIVATAYEQRTGAKIEPMVCQAADGAG